MWTAATPTYGRYTVKKTVRNSPVDIADAEGQLQDAHTASLIVERMVHCIMLHHADQFILLPVTEYIAGCEVNFFRS